MNNYEELLTEAEEKGLIVKEKNIPGFEGRIYGNRIAISQDIETEARKADILAEEIGHHDSGCGDIMDQDTLDKRKQEHRARLLAYDRRIGLRGIIECYEHGCRSAYEMAECLGCSEPFLKDALVCYTGKYGKKARLDQYLISFDPLSVMKVF